MTQDMGNENKTGVSICVPIPAEEPKLYGMKATNDILLFLSHHPYDQFTQRELARQIEYSDSTVGRAIDILVENKLVLSEYKSNKKLIRINRNRLSIPDDPFLQVPQEEFQKPVAEATEQIKTELESIMGIVLYGSVARGEADRQSDIDLWVLVQEDRAANQREANIIQKNLANQEFNGERYDFHIAVESVDSIPSFIDNIRHIVLSGIPVYKTENFVKLRNLLAHGEFDE